MIWDSDRGTKNEKPEDNHRLLRLCGQEIEDWPSRIAPDFACFTENFKSTVRNEIGSEIWDPLCLKWREQFDYLDNATALKRPAVVAGVIREASQDGHVSESLSEILANIQELVT